MRPLFHVLSVVAVVFGVSGMAYYYHSIPIRPASLTAQVEESAQEAASSKPYWQSVYPKKVFDVGRQSYNWITDKTFTPPAGWGWPMRHDIGAAQDPYTSVINYYPVPTYFAAYPGTNTTQAVLLETVTAFDSARKKWVTTTDSNRDTDLVVKKGSAVTLEWVCQDEQTGDGNHFYNYGYTTRLFEGGAKGTGFSTGDKPMGRVTVKPARTTTYTLTCRNYDQFTGYYGWCQYNSGFGGCQFKGYKGVAIGDISVPLRVVVTNCDPASPQDTGTYKLEAKKTQGVSITVDGKSYAVCLVNPTNNNYLIPAGSSEELDAFLSQVDAGGLNDASGTVRRQ